ncbi:MAG: hypothetical protein K1060chlam2_00883 [Chlamydiae bacterium]|nr:hypothetical protein [Chlamydiota bacterium]
MKSERLKKLELELQDLEQWLNLGLVPKKDIEKHTVEINALGKKIEVEKNRLRSLKESGETDEYTAPKRNPQARPAYQEPHTMPGVEMEGGGMTDSGLEVESETTFTTETTTVSDDESSEETPTVFEEEDDPFSDKNRWRRGILEDPDADSW